MTDTALSGTLQQGYAPRDWQPPLDAGCGGFKAEGGHGKDKRSNVVEKM